MSTRKSAGLFNVKMSTFVLGLSFLFTISRTNALSCGDDCAVPKANDCTIVVRDTLGPEFEVDDMSFECILDPIDSGSDVELRVPIHATDRQKKILEIMFESGDIISEVSTLQLDSQMQISRKGGIFLPASRDTFAIGGKSNHNSRHLATTKGDKHVLVVKVIDSEGRMLQESTDQISDDIFGTFGDQMTLKSQMEACSYGSMNIISGLNDEHEASPGVIEVTIDKSLTETSRMDILQAMIQETQLLLGHSSLPGPYSHVMFLLEGCYSGKYDPFRIDINRFLFMTLTLFTIL